MFHSIKQIAFGSVSVLAVALPAVLMAPAASAAPLQGAGSAATLVQGEMPKLTDVSYRRNRAWVPGAIVAGAALGVLGAAAADQAYGGAYCDPNYDNCGYPAQEYYSYYPAPTYAYPAYGRHRYYGSDSGRQQTDLYGPTDNRASH